MQEVANEGRSQQKAAQRTQARESRKALTPAYREAASATIAQLVVASSPFAAATVVASYEWMHSEVQTTALNDAIRAAGKRLIVPEVLGPETMRFIDADDRSTEVALAAAQLVIVPGVGFDLCGRRVGNGRGYYDRALAVVSGLKVAVAYDAQILPEIYVEATDITLDVIVSESGAIFGRL